MAHGWDQKRAADHIDKKLADVEEVVIKNYVRDMSLENIKTNEAYKVDAAHIYVDIVNLDGILGTTATEGVTSHKRALRFLNQHYRAVSRILNETETKRITTSIISASTRSSLNRITRRTMQRSHEFSVP